MSITQIQESEISKFQGKLCPACGQGIMQMKLKHDAFLGNYSVLQCNKENPCLHIIEILFDQK